MFHPTIINFLIYVDGYIILIVITSKKRKYEIMLPTQIKTQQISLIDLAINIRKMDSVVHNELSN